MMQIHNLDQTILAQAILFNSLTSNECKIKDSFDAELELKTTVRKLMKDTCKKTAFVFDNEIYKHLVFLFINSNK